MIEEPENHLCFSSMNKMLHEIINRQPESQILIATHSNMIASRLNLANVQWITENEVISLKNVNKNIAAFFEKSDNNNFLQLLLSKKIILVEGVSEYLLLPKIYQQVMKRTVEDDKITIISCNGISYNNYLEIVKDADKRIAVITDNDKKLKKVTEAEEFNKKNEKHHIFTDNCVENDWTWEASFYNLNKIILGTLIKVEKSANYLFHDVDYGQILGKMLNNKADTAYQMLISKETFVIPQYVEDAIIWLNK